MEDIPRDIILEISRFLEDKHKIALISTCKKINAWKNIMTFNSWIRSAVLMKTPYRRQFRRLTCLKDDECVNLDDVKDVITHLYLENENIKPFKGIRCLIFAMSYEGIIRHEDIPSTVKELHILGCKTLCEDAIPYGVKTLTIGFRPKSAINISLSKTVNILGVGFNFNNNISLANVLQGLSVIYIGEKINVSNNPSNYSIKKEYPPYLLDLRLDYISKIF